LWLLTIVLVFISVTLYILPKWPTSDGIKLMWNPLVGAFQNRSAQKGTQSETALDSQALAVPPYSLTGISVWGQDRYAFVNGEIVTIGDTVDGAIISDILEREIVLNTKAGEFRLKIPS